MVPVNRSILVDGWQADTIRQSVIGRNLDKCGFWVFIIVHNLRHRCGGTTCEGQVTTRYQRTQPVIRCCLTPSTRNEGSNGLMVRNGSHSHWLLIELAHLTFIVFQPPLHVFWDISSIKGAVDGIAQDGWSTIITTHHDKALLLTNIKYIVADSRLRSLQFPWSLRRPEHLALSHSRMSHHKLTCFLHCLLLCYRGRHQQKR